MTAKIPNSIITQDQLSSPLLRSVQWSANVSHPPNLLLVCVLLQARVEVLPPLEKHRIADELEPRRKFERWVFEEPLQAIRRHILRGPDFVGVGIDIDVG